MGRSIGNVTTETENTSAPQSVEILIEGMHCGSCVALIEETLVEHDGVVAATVDLEAAKATIGFDPDLVEVAALAAAIEEAGYAATPVG